MAPYKYRMRRLTRDLCYDETAILNELLKFDEIYTAQTIAGRYGHSAVRVCLYSPPSSGLSRDIMPIVFLEDRATRMPPPQYRIEMIGHSLPGDDYFMLLYNGNGEPVMAIDACDRIGLLLRTNDMNGVEELARYWGMETGDTGDALKKIA